MEKSIAPKGYSDVSDEREAFRKDWEKAGKPKYFTWDTKNGGRTYTRAEFQLRKRQEERKIQTRKREIELDLKIADLRQRFELKVARRRLRQRFEGLRAHKLARRARL